MIIIDTASDIPLYKQLSTQIMEAIVRGNLSTGDTLPSVRALAGDLGVNMHTVNKSFHELEAKGMIEIAPKRGAIITADKNRQVSKDSLDQIGEAFRPIVAEALVNGMKKEELFTLITDVITTIEEG